MHKMIEKITCETMDLTFMALNARIHVNMLCVFVCTPVHVHVYVQFDRCWTAIVINFNAYRAALPTGGWHTGKEKL